MNCGCNDYTRSQALRRVAAEAGKGLPAIEPGMPLPAGTGLTRRSLDQPHRISCPNGRRLARAR